jgi:GntR family transcriptional regulator
MDVWSKVKLSLNKYAARPLYQQLADVVRGLIDEGQLGPGDRLPSEIELADMFGMSRMTARRALDSLVTDGFLFRQSGKGTFVAEAKVPYAPATLFSFSTVIGAMGLSVVTRMIDVRQMTAPPNVARALGLLPREEVVFISRLRYVENQPMAIHTSYLPSRYYARIFNEDLTTRPLAVVMEDISGLRLVSSQDYVEATLAPSDEAELLQIQPGAPLLLVQGTAYAEGELPIRFTRSVYRGDHFRFYVTAREGLAFEVKPPGLTPTPVRLDAE